MNLGMNYSRTTDNSKKIKNILVVYYSQSNQLTNIIKSILEDVEDTANISVTYEALRPKKPYPFPWSRFEFCDTLPESTKGIPCELEPLECDLETDYDLVILGYTIWFLAPSIPINSFLQTHEAKVLLNNTPILTVIGCRNMWVLAQENIKQSIHQLNGKLAGCIVLKDRTPNLIGLITIARWMLSGKKKKFLGILPKPGVSEKDISEATRFGSPIRKALLENDEFDLTQEELNKLDAVDIDFTLLSMEKRIKKIFNLWAGYILKKGGAGDKNRKNRIWGFYVYLHFVFIFILPIMTVISPISRAVRRKRPNTDMNSLNHYQLNEHTKK